MPSSIPGTGQPRYFLDSSGNKKMVFDQVQLEREANMILLEGCRGFSPNDKCPKTSHFLNWNINITAAALNLKYLNQKTHLHDTNIT